MTEDALPFSSRPDVRTPLTPVASRRTALPLPGRDRTAWRIAAVVLILRACHGRSATLEQLHVLMWYLRDDSNAAVLRSAWDRVDGAPRSLRAFDPMLDDTLSVARGAGLVEQKGTGRQVLSAVGGRLADNLRSGELMEIEQRRLTELGSISETRMWERLGRPGDDLTRRSSLG
jgi:hypothetical protein